MYLWIGDQLNEKENRQPKRRHLNAEEQIRITWQVTTRLRGEKVTIVNKPKLPRV